MEKTLFQELPKLQRIQMLRDNADTAEEIGYSKALSGDQLAELKDKLVENNIQLRDVRADKKAANKMYNDQIKQLEEEGDELTQQLKNKTDYVKEECYKFVEGDEVGYYNQDGELVYSRPARNEERQMTIQAALRRTGTDN